MSFLSLSFLALLLSPLAHGSPTLPYRIGLAGQGLADHQKRDHANGAYMSISTEQSINTDVGVMQQNCVFTFSPIILADGSEGVEEVKTCTNSLTDDDVENGSNNTQNGTNNAQNGTTNTGSSSTVSAVSVNGLSTIAGTATTTTTQPTNTGVNGAAQASSSSSTTASTTSTTGAAVVVNGLSTLASSAPVPTTTAANGAQQVQPTAQTTAAAAIATAASSTTNANPTVAAAAEQASPSGSSAAFAMPGKKMSVLPIGLGVFAGISVIALIVVGLVTYERTKYRKAFRQRKLAEAGTGMGYGGMAQQRA